MLLPHIPLILKEAAVLRYLGIADPTSVPAAVLGQVKQCLGRSKLLLEPRAVFRGVPLAPAAQGFLLGGSLRGLQEKTLQGCAEASVVTVTVGKTIEAEAALLYQRGESSQAVMLDAVGTAAVEEVSRYVMKLLASQYRLRGLHPTRRFAPGCQAFAIEWLPALWELAGGEQIGVTLNDHLQMTPSKSLCFMVGWSPQPSDNRSKCTHCNQINCQFRSE